jgi:hypothetical protein
LEDAKKEYEERVKEIEEAHTQYSAAWINNTDGYRDAFWNDAETVRHTVSNLSLVRSSRFPSHAMAEAGMRLVKDAEEIMENVFECEDLMGITYADDEMDELMGVIRERLQGTEEEEEEDSDYEDTEGSDSSQWEDI